MSIFRLPVAHIGAVLLACAASACGSGSGARDDNSVISVQDSTATAGEVRASLAGEVAPGAQAYSYRGLYAGIPRSRLEARSLRLAPHHPSNCHATGKLGDELTCEYDVTLGPDSAAVHVEAVFAPDGTPATGRVAREVTVSRQLPLDVDGVRVARQLADAFEKQTALLDKRDATFGHHQAQVRMGTVNGVRLNYVDVNVTPKGGREVLTVRMSRTGDARSTQKPTPAQPNATPVQSKKSTPVQSPSAKKRN
jgi:hypothetical protein